MFEFCHTFRESVSYVYVKICLCILVMKRQYRGSLENYDNEVTNDIDDAYL
jgi:hypothetical protein